MQTETRPETVAFFIGTRTGIEKGYPDPAPLSGEYWTGYGKGSEAPHGPGTTTLKELIYIKCSRRVHQISEPYTAGE